MDDVVQRAERQTCNQSLVRSTIKGSIEQETLRSLLSAGWFQEWFST